MSFGSSVYLLFFCFFSYQCCGSAKQLLESVVVPEIVFSSGQYKEIEEVVASGVQKPFLLKKLVLSSDAVLNENEANYLMGLSQGNIVSAQQFALGIFYLFKKNSCQKITCSFIPDEDGYALTIFIQRAWIFKNLEIKGIFFGKDVYRQLYLLESGDFFDDKKHTHSIKKIIRSLRTEGYYAAKVDDVVIKSELDKKVSVSLFLNKGPRYFVQKVSLEIENTPSDDIDVVLLRAKLLSFYENKIVGAYYSKELLDKETLLCKKYLSQKGYPFAKVVLQEQVDSQAASVSLLFHVDLQKKKQFVFAGNSFFSDDFLQEQLLIFGHSTWLLPACILTEKLEQMYRKKGFFDSKVAFVETAGAIFFTIAEGARYAIKKIVLQGVDSFSHDYIKKSFFSSIVYSKWYDDEQLESSIDQLLSYYFKQGFWHAVFLQKKFNCLGRKKEYEVIITVDEGVRSYFSSISLDLEMGTQLKSPLVFVQTVGQPCTTDFIEKQKYILIAQLEKQGFSDVIVHPEITEHEAGVALVWRVSTNKKKVDFGKTIINGRGALPYDAIMRELAYKEGESWDRKKIKNSFMRLKQLDMFEHIYFHPDYSVSHDDACPVILKLKKNEACELRMRGGLGLGIIGKKNHFKGLTYTAGGTFLYRNPTNHFDLLRAEVDCSSLQQSARLSYVYPWLGGISVGSLFQFYANKSQYLGIMYHNQNIYSLIRQGFLTELSYSADQINFMVNTGVELMKIQVNNKNFQTDPFLYKKLAHAIQFDPALLDVKNPYFYCEPVVVANFLDDPLYPTYGSYTMVSLKSMVPLITYHSSSFLRVLLQQSFFVPIRSLVMALRLKCGYLFCCTFNQVFPSERFYLGGAYSIRGYDTNMCPPFGQLLNDQEEVEYIPQGGTAMVQGTIEARIPVYGNLGAVVFQDMGYLNNKSWRDIFRDPLLASTGVGIRLKTPIGRLCLDIACQWLNGYPSISQRVWFLTFEQDF